METEAIVLRTVKIWLDGDGILRIAALPGAEETLEDAKRNVAASEKIITGGPRPMLVDIREIKSQSRDARVYYARPQTARIVGAYAILVGSPISRVIGNFVLGFNKMNVPTRLFTSEAEALAWLKGFLG
jgi:hypothetical protein